MNISGTSPRSHIHILEFGLRIWSACPYFSLHLFLRLSRRPVTYVLIEDRMIQDFYAMLGTVRGLIGAMADTQGVVSQINWDQWATERF